MVPVGASLVDTLRSRPASSGGGSPAPRGGRRAAGSAPLAASPNTRRPDRAGRPAEGARSSRRMMSRTGAGVLRVPLVIAALMSRDASSRAGCRARRVGMRDVRPATQHDRCQRYTSRKTEHLRAWPNRRPGYGIVTRPPGRSINRTNSIDTIPGCAQRRAASCSLRSSVVRDTPSRRAARRLLPSTLASTWRTCASTTSRSRVAPEAARRGAVSACRPGVAARPRLEHEGLRLDHLLPS